jgi:hypothetical protein
VKDCLFPTTFFSNPLKVKLLFTQYIFLKASRLAGSTEIPDEEVAAFTPLPFSLSYSHALGRLSRFLRT